MFGISPFTLTLIAWGVVTTLLALLLIYRSLLAMKEDDQLFLDPAESKLEAEQREIINRLDRLSPYTKGLGFLSALLLVIMAGAWVYQGITGFSR